MSCWSPAVTSSWKSTPSPSLVDPMWSPAATSAAMTDDDLQAMCLDDLLSREVSYLVNTDYQRGPNENWEVPIHGGFLDSEVQTTPGAQPAECSEADSYESPMVPLESIGGGITTPSPECIRVCRALLGLARVNGKPPFQMRQGRPLQHHTMVYNITCKGHPEAKSMAKQPQSKHNHGQRWSL